MDDCRLVLTSGISPLVHVPSPVLGQLLVHLSITTPSTGICRVQVFPQAVNEY